ncbi:MAG: YvcK family protein [Actinobacteria bacterium]|nr:YvcK family protein [Actinomycetota bacterium]
MKKITVVGGGTGTFVVLSGLKEFKLDLGVIVSMTDSGGSTGRLRDQLGVLPPGDLRQCLLALSEAPQLWRKLFLYRFEKGDLAGHNFGNIFLSALEKVTDNYEDVVKTASYVLQTKGQVIPVTFAKTHLCVKYQSGKIIKGEGEIEDNINETSVIEKAFLEPDVLANPEATRRINISDWLIIGPGDLYTSIIPVLLTKGIKESIISAKTKIIYIMNLMTKSGQTNNYKASQHLDSLGKYLGKKPDIVILNSGKISLDILEWYKEHNEKIVENDLLKDRFTGNIIQSDLIDSYQFKQNTSDKLTRSILRHDSKKLAKVIEKLI